MLMALVMCLTLLPVSAIAATMPDGSTVTQLGTGSASTTLTNDCDAAVKYSIILGSSAPQEVILDAHESLAMKGNLGDNYAVTWLEGADSNYVYTKEPDQKTLTGTIGSVTTTRYYYKNTQNGGECTNEVANTITYLGQTIDTYQNVYYDVSSLIIFERSKDGARFVYTNVNNKSESYKPDGLFEYSDSDAYDLVYDAYPTYENTRVMDGNPIPGWNYMFMYKTVEPRTETTEGDANVTFTATAIASGTTGNFTVAALNVDGMPASVKVASFSLDLNDNGPGSEGSKLIGQYIEDSKIDFLALSENFNYYNEINTNAPSYETGFQRLTGGIPTEFSLLEVATIKFPFDTDGLNLMYKKDLTVSGESMTSWNAHYSPDNPNIPILDIPSENGADGMIDKGYRFYQVKVADGVVVDVYILHMDADDTEGDRAARASQIDQLMAAVEANDNGNPIIIMGDTNCRYTRDPLEEKIISKGFSDPWVDQEYNGDCPTYPSASLMVGDLGYQKGEVVDKVFYKNAEGSNLTIEAVSYVVDADGYVYDGTNTMLGDHPPVIVEFEYTLKSNSQEHVCTPVEAWSSDGSGHWHECSDPNCTITMNNEKPNFAEHTYGEYAVTEAATCTEAGTETRTCTVCDYEDSRTIPMTQHTWDDGVVTTQPTATTEGVKTYTCSVCHVTRTEVIPMLNVEYTFTLTFDKESYNVGDTATATISLSKKEGTGSVGTIGFALDVPTGLTMGTITNQVAGAVDTSNGKYAINVYSEEGLAVGQTGVDIATVTFTVNDTFAGETANVTLGLSHHEVTLISQMIPRGSEVVTASATLVKSYTVNLAAGEHVSFEEGAPTSITVTAGTTFIQLESQLPEVAVDQYYEFDGWYNGETKMTDNMAVTGGMTLTAKAKANTYTFTQPTADNATIGNLTGVINGNTATYNQDITFTVSPDSSYAVTGVTYTVGGGDAQNLTAVNGTYTIPGENITGAVTVTVTTVQYHTITFQAGTGATLSGTTTLYVKDGVAGFYSNTSCTVPASLPTPTEQDGYRLAKDTDAEPLWSGDNDQEYTTEELETATFTEDVTLTAQAVKTWTVTFQAGSHVSMTTTQVTVDDGTLFGDVQEPSYAVDKHYSFVGWYNGNDKMEATDTIGSNLTLTATAVASSFQFSEVSNNADVTVTSGVTDNQATYGTDIKFTVAPDSGYAVTGVSYTVGKDGAATSLTAVNGTYTIDGENITNDITVYVTAVQYHTVRFVAGEGVDMTSATAYVKDGQAILYTDTTFAHEFTLPTPTEQGGYRLAADTAAEPLWSDGTNQYQTSALGSSVTFTADATLTAQAVKQWTVTFQPGDHGTLSGADTTLIVDAGHVLTPTEIPAVTANAGYTFTGWSSDVNAAITTNTTFTAQYTNATYTLTLPTIDGVTFTVNGTPVSGNTYTVTHGTDVTIGVDVDEHQVDVDSVTYTIGEGTTGTTVNIGDVPFTIPGNSITGNITLTVDSIPVYAITVTVSGNGTVNGGTTSTQYFNEGTSADTVKEAFEIVANTGYEFVAPAFTAVNGDARYTVTFTPIHYEITVIWDDDQGNGFDYKHPTEDAVCSEDLDFTPDLSEQDPTEIVFEVWYHVGEIKDAEGNTVTDGDWSSLDDADDAALIDQGWTELQLDATGEFVIPHSAITGPVIIYYDTIDTTGTTEGAFEFITEEDYKAAPDGKKVAVLTTAKRASGTYTLDGYGDMFWSSLYDAYVCFVDDDETVDTLPWKLDENTNTVTEIDYSGDINGVGGVTPADSAPINAVLHDIAVEYEITDLMRFRFDVIGDKQVSAQDIMWILNQYTGASSNP